MHPKGPAYFDGGRSHTRRNMSAGSEDHQHQTTGQESTKRRRNKGRKPLPLWVLTYKKDHKELLYKTKGLLLYRITIEDLKQQENNLSQCYRCQEYGHKAAFCKQKNVCKTCAGEHDSRSCPVLGTTQPKCNNCQGKHLASAPECPARQALIATLRKRTPQLQRPRSSPPEEFPPLPSVSQTTPTDGGMSTVLELFQVLKSPVSENGGYICKEVVAIYGDAYLPTTTLCLPNVLEELQRSAVYSM